MTSAQKLLLCLDPGQSKIGICILNFEGSALELKVITLNYLENYLKEIILKNNFKKIILGNGTAHKKVLKVLSEKLNLSKEKIILIEEKFSTEKARKFYFKKNPPKGLKKIIPLSLQTPKENIDSYAAWVLGMEWLKNKED